MKKFLILTALFMVFSISEARKTRSDKGGHHKSHGIQNTHDASPAETEISETKTKSNNKGNGFAIVGLGVVIVIFGLYRDFKKGNGIFKKLKSQRVRSIFPEKSLPIISELERRVGDNESLQRTKEKDELFQNLMGYPINPNLDLTENIMGFDYLTKKEKSLEYQAGDYVYNLIEILFDRSDYGTKPAGSSFFLTFDEDETYKKYGINLKKGENLLLRKRLIDFSEEKSITIATMYGGLQFRTGMGAGMSYRSGIVSSSPIKKEKFVTVDRGDFFLTDQRIIFIGKERNKNKTIVIDKVLEFGLFNDGLLIGTESGKKSLFTFPELKQENPLKVDRDDINLITRVLDRIISKNLYDEVSK